ncbi:MAG TPA: hypothetical protein VLQ79_02320, partial [Myxococcaceae bacterium]|nr:hypothetical protein [Myxococcaceae bacterium]
MSRARQRDTRAALAVPLLCLLSACASGPASSGPASAGTSAARAQSPDAGARPQALVTLAAAEVPVPA